MRNDAARIAGSAFGEMLNQIADRSQWRERRMDAIVEAFARSTRETSYQEERDELFRERGLGRIED
jgi:hypothetical protein